MTVIKISIPNKKQILKFDLIDDAYCCGQNYIGNIELDKSIKPDFKNFDDFLDRIIICGSDSITSILCTVIDEELKKVLLEEIGFKEIGSFINCKTGNTVYNLQYIVDHGYIYDEDEE